MEDSLHKKNYKYILNIQLLSFSKNKLNVQINYTEIKIFTY